MTATTTIESPEQRLERIEKLCAENSEAMSQHTLPSPSPRFPAWALALAAAVGAVAGAIAVLAVGWGLG